MRRYSPRRQSEHVLIRPAKPDDLPMVRSLEQLSPEAAHWSTREYHALFAPGAPARIALVVVDEITNQIQGFVIALCAGDEWEIENIVIAPGQRQKGLATGLIGELLGRARAAGATSVLLEVRESNTAALRLYEKMRFRRLGLRRNYYQWPTEDALLLAFHFDSVTKSLEAE